MTYVAPYRIDNWDETIAAMHSGKVIEVDEGVFRYFLGVLPPVYMQRHMEIGGRRRRVEFGFAEGAEPITAFWCDDGKYWAQRTQEMNRG